MIILYNFRKDRLEVHRSEITDFLFKPDSSSLFHWKDAAYLLDYDPKGPDLRVIDFQGSTCSEAKMSFTLHTSKFDLPDHGARTSNTLLFGDETFLISVFAPRFYV